MGSESVARDLFKLSSVALRGADRYVATHNESLGIYLARSQQPQRTKVLQRPKTQLKIDITKNKLKRHKKQKCAYVYIQVSVNQGFTVLGALQCSTGW